MTFYVFGQVRCRVPVRLKEIADLFPVFVGMALPFVALSLLNRYAFEKIVAVIGEDGIYLENYFVPWDKLQQVTYVPDMPSKSSRPDQYSRAVFTVEDASNNVFDVKARHFPLYGLLKIRHLHPELPTKLDKTMIAILSLAILTISLVCAFFSARG